MAEFWNLERTRHAKRTQGSLQTAGQAALPESLMQPRETYKSGWRQSHIAGSRHKGIDSLLAGLALALSTGEIPEGPPGSSRRWYAGIEMSGTWETLWSPGQGAASRFVPGRP